MKTSTDGQASGKLNKEEHILHSAIIKTGEYLFAVLMIIFLKTVDYIHMVQSILIFQM